MVLQKGTYIQCILYTLGLGLVKVEAPAPGCQVLQFTLAEGDVKDDIY